MRCLELFAGAGGAAIGLERAGLTHAALCEWDRAACATLRAAGFGPVVEGDVRDIDAIAAAAGPEPIGAIWSSFPCQAFSAAGKRLGAADERNGWPWTVDAIDRFRPTWFLGENVRGLLSPPGNYLARVILPDLHARFACVGWWLLDAADYGVPQHRRRVILWAGPRPLAMPAPTHGLGRPLPWVGVSAALSVPPGAFVQSGICRSDKGGRGAPREVTRPSPTVSSSSRIYLQRDNVIRALTPSEHAVLQGFPPSHPFKGTKARVHRQIGNAVPPLLAEMVGRALLEADCAV
jgi:DNA (cytosine-5)-methyltransferase 1